MLIQLNNKSISVGDGTKEVWQTDVANRAPGGKI